MSIYALPGPLYKLISSGASTKSSKADAEEACFSKDTGLIGCTPLPTGTSVPAVASNPLLRRASSGSLPGSQPSDPNSMSGSSSSNHGRTNISRSKSNVKLAVTEAKIDPARLIRSLSITKPETKKAPSASCEGTSSDESPKAANSSSSCSSQRRRRSRKTDSSSDSSDCNRQCDPHEDAINFEISVNFNGRSYTAVRTLPRILQFRYDLIEEIGARRMWRERRRKRKERRRRPSKPPQMAKVYDLSDDEDESSQDDSQDDNSIPELPRLSEDASSGGGFTMLNALLRPYGPALEGWLHRVIDIVPHDSQCLTQFLWEPLAAQAQDTPATTTSSSSRCHERRKTYERRGSSTLLAIEETSDLEQYDSDTDNYLLNH